MEMMPLFESYVITGTLHYRCSGILHTNKQPHNHAIRMLLNISSNNMYNVLILWLQSTLRCIWILITEVVNALNKFEPILPFSFEISMILRYLILTCWQYWLAHTIRGKSLQFISAKLIMFETCNLASWLAKKDLRLRFAPKNFVSNRWKTAPRDVNFTKKKRKDYSHKHFWPIFNIWFISWKWYLGTRVATIKPLLLILLYQ